MEEHIVQYSVFWCDHGEWLGKQSPAVAVYETFMLCSLGFSEHEGHTPLCVLWLKVMMSFQGCDGIELLDWLFDQNDGILRHEEPGRQGNHHTWLVQDSNVREAVGYLMSLMHATNSWLLCVYCIFFVV